MTPSSRPPSPRADLREQRVTGFGGLELQVHEHGPAGAPTVVLVHGYPDDHAVWDPLVERLAADHHVVTYDVRGAGTSGVPADRSGYRMEVLNADLAAVVDATSPGVPVHLVAHDWGSIQSWSAVTDPEIGRRFASYTSMSGPGPDHVDAWVRAHRRPGGRRWTTAARQGLRSWYIVAMRLPQATSAMRGRLGARLPKVISESEGLPIDERWPGPHVIDNAVNGIELYRANMFGWPHQPVLPTTEIPVQVLVPHGDPYVTPGLLDGVEAIGPNVVRRELSGKHWLPRAQPDLVARLVAEQVAAIEGARPAGVPERDEVPEPSEAREPVLD